MKASGARKIHRAQSLVAEMLCGGHLPNVHQKRNGRALSSSFTQSSTSDRSSSWVVGLHGVMADVGENRSGRAQGGEEEPYNIAADLDAPNDHNSLASQSWPCHDRHSQTFPLSTGRLLEPLNGRMPHFPSAPCDPDKGERQRQSPPRWQWLSSSPPTSPPAAPLSSLSPPREQQSPEMGNHCICHTPSLGASDNDIFVAKDFGVMAETAAPPREEENDPCIVSFPAKGADASGEYATSSASASTDLCDGARSQVGFQQHGCKEGSRVEAPKRGTPLAMLRRLQQLSEEKLDGSCTVAGDHMTTPDGFFQEGLPGYLASPAGLSVR